MIISHDEYVKICQDNNPEYSKYVLHERETEDRNTPETFITIVLSHGMLEFNVKHDYCLAGPFKTKDGRSWAMYRLTDHTREHKLPSREQIEANQRTYEKYNAYTYGWNKVTNILGKDWHLVTLRGGPCGRASLTHQEYLRVEKELGKEEMDRLYQDALISSNDEKWYTTTPHIEMPVKLYIAGNDDSSYTRLFETVEEGEKYLKELADVPTTSEQITSDMYFTN